MLRRGSLLTVTLFAGACSASGFAGFDAGVAADAGESFDSGFAVHDGGMTDSGSPEDAGLQLADAGVHEDGGQAEDAGHHVDAGAFLDGGQSLDAGSDAGNLIDAGVTESDAGITTADAGLCASGSTQGCQTSCGSIGTETCSSGAWGACVRPPETCNLIDDNCDGSCDNILGCRVAVDRSYDTTNGLHFFTTSDSEATCCGYSIESYGDFYLYESQQTGLVPFYRCRTTAGAHLYTTDATCAGNILEGPMGWAATGAVCGSVPLYGLHNATSGDYLYTLSSAEAGSAEAGGYAPLGVTAYVWPAIAEERAARGQARSRWWARPCRP